MAILKMHYIGLDPVLRAKAQKVADPTTPKMKKLVHDMVESMYHYSGVGIAANQVGSTDRVCVIQLPEDEEPRVLFNLQITRKEGSRDVIEGCLSLPGYQGRIERAQKIWARAIGADGKSIKFKAASDLLAQALEHECDHLDGILYTDLLKSNDDLWEVEVGSEETDEG